MSSVPKGYMEDAHGNLVPLAKIKPEHLEEDRLVQELTKEARALCTALAEFKGRALGDTGALRELIAEKYGATLGGRKGNMTLKSFDGRFQVQVAVADAIAFGPELTAAKALIDECVLGWGDGADENLMALVNHAFQVNKAGRIDTQRVLSLRRLKISDAKWTRAMEAIADAVRVTGSTTYVRFYERDTADGPLNPISLDLAKL